MGKKDGIRSPICLFLALPVFSASFCWASFSTYGGAAGRKPTRHRLSERSNCTCCPCPVDPTYNGIFHMFPAVQGSHQVVGCWL